MRTLGKELLAEFEGPPYGWDPAAVRVGAAALIRAGELSLLINKKIVRPVSVCQTDIFKSAILFAQTEGFIPAPETAHAVHAAIVEALAAKAKKKSKCIVVNYSGHGHFDLAAYDNYLAGHLKDYHYPKEMIDKALDELKCIGV